MAGLAAAAPATLVHTDLNPSNVLVRRERPYVIDWQAAHAGPLHLDLPHHLHTVALAAGYRRALAARGVEIDASAFAVQYRTAARYTALRYLWWTLDAWREDRAAGVWVEHYVAMLDGECGRPVGRRRWGFPFHARYGGINARLQRVSLFGQRSGSTLSRCRPERSRAACP